MAIFPLVSAVKIDSGNIVQSNGLNLTFNFTTTKYLDILEINSSYINFNGLRDLDESTETLSFIIIETNKRYYSTELPYISSPSSTQKIISSNLTQAVNVTAVVNVASGGRLTQIIYTPTGGSPQTFYENNFIESGNTVTLVLPNLIGNNNVLQLVYGCADSEKGSYVLIMIFTSLAVLSLCFVLLFKNGKLNLALDPKLFIFIFILVIIGIILTSAIGDTIYANCGVV